MQFLRSTKAWLVSTIHVICDVKYWHFHIMKIYIYIYILNCRLSLRRTVVSKSIRIAL